MKEFIEKLIGRLEEEKSLVPYNRLLDTIDEKPKEVGQLMTYQRTIEIVNQLAEEYINCSTDTSTDCSTDNGWIACSERLPKVYEDTKSSDVVLVCGYDAESDYSWQAMGFYVKTEAIKRWFFAECKDTDKPIDWIDIVAWQPLPAPYQPKGE